MRRPPPPHPRGAPRTVGSGRKKGTLNRRTVEMRALMASLCDDVDYQHRLRADFRRRRVHPTIEALVWSHVVGKPVERVQLSADVTMNRKLELWPGGQADGRAGDGSDKASSVNRGTEQGCRTTDSRREIQARTGRAGAIVAHDARAREGQSVERRSVSMRVGNLACPLGAGGDGPVHAPHRGVRRAPRRRGRCGIVSHVQPSCARPDAPKYLSSDHDRLFQFHQWQANLRILGVEEIKTVPFVPLSHPFVERLIGTIRRECLDQTLFWTAADLAMKLHAFQNCYNGYRAHASLEGRPPASTPDESGCRASLGSYRWRPHCRGLYQTPIAA